MSRFFDVSVSLCSLFKAQSHLALLRATLLHYGFEGRKATAGNLAFPFSPSDMKVLSGVESVESVESVGGVGGVGGGDRLPGGVTSAAAPSADDDGGCG